MSLKEVENMPIRIKDPNAFSFEAEILPMFAHGNRSLQTAVLYNVNRFNQGCVNSPHDDYKIFERVYHNFSHFAYNTK